MRLGERPRSAIGMSPIPLLRLSLTAPVPLEPPSSRLLTSKLRSLFQRHQHPPSRLQRESERLSSQLVLTRCTQCICANLATLTITRTTTLSHRFRMDARSLPRGVARELLVLRGCLS